MLQNQVAIVTGAGRGLGKAIALELAQHGARIVATGRSSEPLEAVAAEIQQVGHEAVAMVADVSKPMDVTQLVERTLEKFGQINILVNNAAIVRASPLLNSDPDEWKHVLEVNLYGPYLCARAVLPAMKRQGHGLIINLGAEAARIALPNASAYTASKHGLIGLTYALAAEAARHGVRVTIINPGELDRSRWAGGRGTKIASVARLISLIATLPGDVDLLEAVLRSSDR